MESISYGSSKLSHLGQIKLLKHFSVEFCLAHSAKNYFSALIRKYFIEAVAKKLTKYLRTTVSTECVWMYSLTPASQCQGFSSMSTM